MATAKQVIAEATKHIGYTETGNNHSMFGKWFGMDGAAWCAMFVSYCMNHAGAGSIIKGAQTAKGSAQVSKFVAHAKKHKWAKIAPKDAHAGDIVIFNFPGGYETDHVGFIRAASKGKNIYTIEGNTSSGAGSQSNGGGVYKRTRSFGVVHSIWRPPYDVETVVEPAVAPVVAEPAPVAPVSPVEAISTPEAPKTFTSLKEGSKGDKVKELQKRLGITADGIFGPITKRNVVAFQEKKGLPQTGIVDETTWNRMFK
jgi:hypothetical protein